MFGIESDIAFRAAFALELVQKRIDTGDPDAIYKLILIDIGFDREGYKGAKIST